MEKYEHGGGIWADDVSVDYDFSVNTNPLGMPSSVKKKLTESVWLFEKYPDVHCKKLKEMLQKQTGYPVENIVIGNGASELLYKAAAIRPETALLAVPCFSEYEKALREQGTKIRYYARKPDNGFRLLPDYLKAMEGVDLLVLGQPNNPTGDLVGPGLLEQILEQAERQQTFVILDECFIDLVTNDEARENYRKLTSPGRWKGSLLLLNALTKNYALAGLRLGYGVCTESAFAEKIECMGDPWHVSVPAQIAGVSALQCEQQEGYLEKTRDFLKQERVFLIRELEERGFRTFSPEANFILFQVPGDPEMPELSESLRTHGILIRDCRNFEGLGRGFYRIAVKDHQANMALLKAVDQVENDLGQHGG